MCAKVYDVRLVNLKNKSAHKLNIYRNVKTRNYPKIINAVN